MPIVRNGTQFVLQNDYVRRIIDIEKGPVTTTYHVRPKGKAGDLNWLPLFAFEKHHPFEAAVCVDGAWIQAGPWTPDSSNWKRPGEFRVSDASIEQTSLGYALVLSCLPREESTAGLELTLRYELADELPLLIKSVSVHNISSASVMIDNLAIETLFRLRRDTSLRVFTDYYWDTDLPDDYYFGWTRTQFPDPICLPLEPGETFQPFRCFEVCTFNEPNAAAVAVHRAIKAVAPWITEAYVTQIVRGINSYAELEHLAVQAEKDGIEAVHLFVDQVYDYCGDYIPRPDLYPHGDDDLKRLVEHFHKHNLKVLPYCSLTIATHGTQVRQRHMDWEYHGPDGIRYVPEAMGNMCYQSGWGDYITGKLAHIVDDLGFDGLHIDGPYHGLPCLAEHHKHPTSQSVRFMNWAWERDFYASMRARGAYLTAPQEWQSLLLGVHARPGGYTEEDMVLLGGMPFVSASRARLYDFRHIVPACCSWSSLNLLSHHGNSIEASEENPASYDHAYGSTFGYGHPGQIYGQDLYLGPRTQAIHERWVRFFKTYRETLAGEQVHLVRPDGRHPDGMLHVNPSANPPAVAVLFNPSAEPARASFALPLSLAGFEDNGQAMIERIGVLDLDASASAQINVELKPYEVRTVSIRRDAQTG